MDEAIRAKILELLGQHRLMTIATNRPDGWPQATTVGYANDGLTIYFLCGPQRQKAQNITRDNRVSLTIDHDVSDPMRYGRGDDIEAGAVPGDRPDQSHRSDAHCRMDQGRPHSCRRHPRVPTHSAKRRFKRIAEPKVRIGSPPPASRTNFQHGLESPSSPWRLSVVRSGSQFIIRPARLATGCLTGGRITSSSSPTLVVQIVRNDWFPRDGVIGDPVRELPLKTSDGGCGPILHRRGRRPGWRCRRSVP
jgi:hypothetical protein